jgi:hypothetical protein
MKTNVRLAALLAAGAVAGACSGGAAPHDPPPPPRAGAVSLGASGRMTGGTLTADVQLGAPLGSQKASSGTLTSTEPVLTR